MVSESLLTITQAQFGSAIFIAAFGIFVELHYVSKYTIFSNVIAFFLIFASVPIMSYNFLFVSVFFIVGLAVITRDVRHHARKLWVAFLLGSKTLGAAAIYTGLNQNNWLVQFKPLVQYITGVDYVGNELEFHAIVFLIVLGIVHLIGGIVWAVKEYT